MHPSCRPSANDAPIVKSLEGRDRYPLSSAGVMIRSIYVREEDIQLCHVSIKRRRAVRVRDVANPQLPVQLEGVVQKISEYPLRLGPRRWLILIYVIKPVVTRL